MMMQITRVCFFHEITTHLNFKRLSIITCSRRLIFPQTKFPSYNEIIKTLLLRFTLILDFFFANLSIVFFYHMLRATERLFEPDIFLEKSWMT